MPEIPPAAKSPGEEGATASEEKRWKILPTWKRFKNKEILELSEDRGETKKLEFLGEEWKLNAIKSAK
ncbi:hypothetical protein LWI28_015548 [Acer negundo]|uniref:Uncharacterized protein n=1 Tax=Acer negundo TaxID=4023 RepID=A0AAD5NMQ3_ACENE|nr:hypothetical protein LWI28_015548 [Acer negundo]